LGLNIKQSSFPDDLPYATSLKIASSVDFDITKIRDSIRDRILDYTGKPSTAKAIMEQYNSYLYRKGKEQGFSNNTETWDAIILHVNNDGTLQVQEANGQLKAYTHGVVAWNWK
jgi:BirA family biotin operon repressor/biotin-[acetyl-CoA-carboxylase] ligase